ncbi:MAG: hypothetical protein M0Z34_00530 [Nitrospiraceae bacterium]|nr:hypothetical protein [Nitrospiraceae bacterium]
MLLEHDPRAEMFVATLADTHFEALPSQDPSRQALAAPARRRVRGIAAQAVFVALLLAAAHLRKLASLAEKGEPVRRRARRVGSRTSGTTDPPERASAQRLGRRSLRRNHPEGTIVVGWN